MIFDKSVQIKQLTVVEAHGILLVRTDRGRDSRMHVFRLSSFESDACGSEPAAFSRQHMKEQRLERTKGTHLYAVSRLGGSHLRMVLTLILRSYFIKIKFNIRNRLLLLVKRFCYYNGVIRLPGQPGVRQVTLIRSKDSNI